MQVVLDIFEDQVYTVKNGFIIFSIKSKTHGRYSNTICNPRTHGRYSNTISKTAAHFETCETININEAIDYYIIFFLLLTERKKVSKKSQHQRVIVSKS